MWESGDFVCGVGGVSELFLVLFCRVSWGGGWVLTWCGGRQWLQDFLGRIRAKGSDVDFWCL